MGKSSLARSGHTLPFGKRNTTIKTSAPDDLKIDFERAARKHGYGSGAEWLYELVLAATYGQDMLKSLYAQRISALEGIGLEKDQPRG